MPKIKKSIRIEERVINEVESLRRPERDNRTFSNIVEMLIIEALRVGRQQRHKVLNN